MGLISSGINWVQAIELPGGIRSDGAFFGSPRVALVKWAADDQLSGMLFQVYVNECFSGVTVDPEQHQMIVPLPISLEMAVRIEVFAVTLEQASDDFSDELEAETSGSGRVRIVLL